jgi:hypothetical protein
MMHRRNVGCRAVATLLLPAAILAGSLRPAAGEQTPDPGDVIAAYLTLEDWVTAFDLPDPDSPDATVSIDGATGVCVIVRGLGRVLGTGVDVSGDSLMLRRAAGRALAEALGDRLVAQLPADRRGEAGRRLVIQLEVAGELVALPGRTFGEIAEQIEPGLDGIAIRRDDERIAAFPSRMLASNTAGRPQNRLRGMVNALGLPQQTLLELRQREGIGVYRFRTMHLAQSEPGGRPFELYRGQVLVDQSAVDEASIRALGQGIVDHLLVKTGPEVDLDVAAPDAERPPRLQPQPLLGTYQMVANRYDPPRASLRDKALAVFALAHFSAAPRCDGGLEATDRILEELTLRVREEALSIDEPATSAAVALALIEVPDGRRPDDDELEQLMHRAIARCREFDPVDASAASSPHDLALIAGALARAAGTGFGDVPANEVRRAIDRAWASVPEHQWITLLPWIGWAELDLARATGEPIANADRLRALRDLLEATRIGGAPDRAAPRDLIGGFALSGGRRPTATAQSTRPAAFLATMLREPALTGPNERATALDSHMRTMRFIMQLAVDDSMAWSLRTPSRAVGGLRAATWDGTLPTAAQAMGLLAVAETMMSLDVIGRVDAAPDGRNPR